MNLILQLLKSYFTSKNFEKFLEDEEEAARAAEQNENELNNGAQLGLTKRRELVRVIVDFIVDKFGLRPTAFQKSSVARAAIMLFPRLAFKNSQIGGVVSDFIWIF